MKATHKKNKGTASGSVENQDAEEAERYQLRLKDIYKPGFDWRRGAVGLSDLLGKTLDPVISERGLPSAELVTAWSSIVGPRFAECSVLETIKWPFEKSQDKTHAGAGTLVIRVDGPRAVFMQHEAPQIIERVNRFFGYQAIDRVKMIQAPITRPSKKEDKPELPDISSDQKQRLKEYIPEFENQKLDQAMVTLGEAVLRRTLKDR